jgi:hypothetical protein
MSRRKNQCNVVPVPAPWNWARSYKLRWNDGVVDLTIKEAT